MKRALWQAVLFGFAALALALSVNHFRPDGIPLVADWSPQARLKAATGESMVIPLEQAVEFYESKEAVFLDARPIHQFEEGRIPGALPVPWQNVDDHIGLFFEQVVDPEAIIITYCDGEACSLSEDLAVMLRDMGYANVKVLINGWSVWVEAGYPVEKGTWERKSEQ